MKMRTTVAAIAVALAGFAGTALAATSTSPAPETEAAIVSECLQPGDPTGGACGPVDALIRTNFTPREIKMVTEWNASHPDYLLDEIESLHQRFDTVLSHAAAQHDTQPQNAKR